MPVSVYCVCLYVYGAKRRYLIPLSTFKVRDGCKLVPRTQLGSSRRTVQAVNCQAIYPAHIP